MPTKLFACVVDGFDERGVLFLCDRLHDVMITGGVNVYPCDVEVVLSSRRAVDNCAVVGVDAPK
ncbi:hypothetical protein [Pseudomonas sp.]|uniref:hypothetical protein n=1 Tax=Pseudomonas sp. TaxID=306 RepID=UPI003D6FF88D